MSTLSNPEPAPANRSGRPSGAAVIGWLLLAAAVIPFAMAAHGEGKTPLSIALAMSAAAAALFTVARIRRSG